jgi:DNA modification methylase
MQLTYEALRNYIGVDISKEFMVHNKQIQAIIQNRGILKSDNTIILIEGSSSKVDLPDNHADFTITSPPYWNIEYYGNEPEQLGNAKTYQKFLELISVHIKENYRILKSGAYCCYNVNDFIKGGVYLTYHADLIPIFLNVGFVLHTIYIIDLGLPVQAAFVQHIKKTMRFPKRHEYILTFRKP